MIKKIVGLAVGVAIAVASADIVLAQYSAREEIEQSKFVGEVRGQLWCRLMRELGIYDTNELFQASKTYGGVTYQKTEIYMLGWFDEGRNDLLRLATSAQDEYQSENCIKEYERWYEFNRKF